MPSEYVEPGRFGQVGANVLQFDLSSNRSQWPYSGNYNQHGRTLDAVMQYRSFVRTYTYFR